jgi:hypothetical protein
MENMNYSDKDQIKFNKDKTGIIDNLSLII